MRRRGKGEGTVWYAETEARWVAQLTLPGGKKKTKKARTQAEVRRWLLEQRKAVQDNNYLESKDITLGTYLDHYVADVATHTLKPKSLAAFTYIIEKHIKPTLGQLKLTQLRPDQLQALYGEKLNAGFSRRTVYYIHQVLHRTLTQALKWGLVARNVTDLTMPPAVKRKAPLVLSAEQARQLLAFLAADRLYPLYLLAVTSGLRQGELLGVHWEDLDLAQGIVHVNHTVQELRGVGLVISEPKTESSRRAVALPAVTLAALKAKQEVEGETRGLVFKTSHGTPISQRNLLRHFHNTLRKLGMPKMRFHTLRHTFASLMLAQNVHPKIVQEMLGHSSISLTLDTYSHLIPTMQQDASAKINEIFK